VQAERFLTNSLQDLRIARILATSIDSVEPAGIVRKKLENIKLPNHNHLYLLGIGKAAEPMTMSVIDSYNDYTKALIVTKFSNKQNPLSFSRQTDKKITILVGDHPIPDQQSLTAGTAITNFISQVQEDDLLICLISGGGSSLVVAPRNGISLKDTQYITSVMLNNGANIEEMNLIRCQLDHLKGGGLAEATKGKILSLILSDVISDDLSMIASGPTVPNMISISLLNKILDRYGITNLISKTKLDIIRSRKIFQNSNISHVKNLLVANNKSAANSARDQAMMEGFFTKVINTNLAGEASTVGRQLAEFLKDAKNSSSRPFCLISGGETTVTIKGSGKGGRNQELALSTVDILKGVNNAMLVALATDGNDGPTDAAGAVVVGNTYSRAKKLGMSTSDYLARNDSYSFFESLDDLLKPGYTGTNVNDLIFLFGL
jgi:glycerate 2-kinase